MNRFKALLVAMVLAALAHSCASTGVRIRPAQLNGLHLGATTILQVQQLFGTPEQQHQLGGNPTKMRLYYSYFATDWRSRVHGEFVALDFVGGRLEGYVLMPLTQQASESLEPLYDLKPWSMTREQVVTAVGEPRGKFSCDYAPKGCPGGAQEYWIWFEPLPTKTATPSEVADHVLQHSIYLFFESEHYIGCRVPHEESLRGCRDSFTRPFAFPREEALRLGTTSFSQAREILGKPFQSESLVDVQSHQWMRYYYVEGAPPGRPTLGRMMDLIFVDDALTAWYRFEAPIPVGDPQTVVALEPRLDDRHSVLEALGQPNARIDCAHSDYCPSASVDEMWIWSARFDPTSVRGALHPSYLMAQGVAAHFEGERYVGCSASLEGCKLTLPARH